MASTKNKAFTFGLHSEAWNFPVTNFTNTANVSSNTNDSNIANNSDTEDTLVDTLPVANPDNYAVDEDVTLNEPASGVLTNDNDPDGPNALTAILMSTPSSGILNFNNDGSFDYTPDSNFNGIVTFTYKTNDGLADSNVETVTINVNPVNDAPVADDQNINTLEDIGVAVTLTGSDVENDSLAFSLVSGPSSGTLIGTTPNVTYIPNQNFAGSDFFTFKANDGQADSNIATISITITPVNDAPVAINDSYNVDEDGTLSVPAAGVLDNDIDVDGNTLSAALVSNVAQGTLVLNLDGSFVYTPNADFNGSDSFTYTAGDGFANSGVATVNITVNSVNDVPVAVNDSYSVNEDVTLTVSSAAGVLSNDTDVENNTLTAILVSSTQNGSLALNNNGSFVYTPDSNFNGSDSFTYKTNDGSDDSQPATVTITVTPINDDPVTSDDSASTPQDTDVTVDLLDDDSDVDGDTLSITNVGSAGNGTVTNNNDGTVTYTPSTGFFGDDSFTYTIQDGNGGSDTATVNITVIQAVPQITISINDTTVIEPANGAVDANLTISLSAIANTDVTVDFATADGTATEASDYTGNSGSVTITAGNTSASVTVQVLADAASFEGNETILVNLSNANGATIDDGQGTITVSETCLFCDDFEDSLTATDWTYVKPNWVEANGSLQGTPSKRKAIAIASPAFGGCTNCSINTSMSTAGGTGNRVWLLGWYIDKKNTIELLMKEENDKLVLKHRVNGTIASKMKGIAVIQPNVSYNVDVSFDGTNFVVRIDGQTVITMPAVASVPNGTIGFQSKNTTGIFAHILVN